jgi:hypothetical protein
MTFGVAPSMTATQELVVPRSIPMTLPMAGSLEPLVKQTAEPSFRSSSAHGFQVKRESGAG